MEYKKVTITFKVIKTPEDEYTAIGFPVGSLVSLDAKEYGDTITLNFGQGDGARFKKEELEPVEAIVTTQTVIKEKETIIANFL